MSIVSWESFCHIYESFFFTLLLFKTRITFVIIYQSNSISDSTKKQMIFVQYRSSEKQCVPYVIDDFILSKVTKPEVLKR